MILFSILQHFWDGVRGAIGQNATKMANELGIASVWEPIPIKWNVRATNVTYADADQKWQMVIFLASSHDRVVQFIHAHLLFFL